MTNLPEYLKCHSCRGFEQLRDHVYNSNEKAIGDISHEIGAAVGDLSEEGIKKATIVLDTALLEPIMKTSILLSNEVKMNKVSPETLINAMQMASLNSFR